MEKIIPEYLKTVTDLELKAETINNLTNYKFLTDSYKVTYDPLEITDKFVATYHPIKHLEFNQIVNSLSSQYNISKGFLQDWFINLIVSTLFEIESRITGNAKNLKIELNDIFENSRKLKAIEKKIKKIRFNRKELMLPQSSLLHYENIMFDFSKMKVSETIIFILSEFDGINSFDTYLEIHEETLSLLTNPPCYYYDRELPIGSEHIENFIVEITDYYFLRHLREIASNLEIKNNKIDYSQLNPQDQRFILKINTLLARTEYEIIIFHILRSIGEIRNASFFSNLFNHFTKDTELKPFFGDSSPKEYMKLVNEIYSEINMERITPNYTLKYRDNFIATTLRYFPSSRN